MFERKPSSDPNSIERKRKTSKWRSALLGSLLFISPSVSSQEDSTFNQDKEPITEDTRSVAGEGKENIENNKEVFKGWSLKGEDAYFRHLAMDSSGSVYTNPWVILSPMQIEVSATKEESGSALIRVPYRYSRNFNTAKATSEEQKKESARFIEQKLREEFAEKILYWDFSESAKEVHRFRHSKEGQGVGQDVGKIEVKNIKIIGFASPEGPGVKGKASIKPGAIDKENVFLAEKRASDMDESLQEALESLGLENEVITEIKGAEAQFTDSELVELAEIARQEGIEQKSDDLQAVFSLMVQWNNGGTLSDKAKEALERIVNSKRVVEIEISYEKGKKTKHVIPLPLLLLLLPPGIRWLKRKPKIRERFNETTSEEELELEKKRQNERASWDSPAFREHYQNALEWLNEGEGTLWAKDISDRLIIDEFNPYLGTKRDDIGYMFLVKYPNAFVDVHEAILEQDGIMRTETMSQPLRELTEDQQQQRLTFTVLKAWERNDLSVRSIKEMGLATNRLHYWQDEQKIAWANVVAQTLFRLHEVYDKVYQKGGSDFQNTITKAEQAVFDEVDRLVREVRSNRKVPERKNIRFIRIGVKRPKHKKYRKKV